MPNRKQRRATAEVGMQVHIRGFITTAPDGSRQHWWVQVAPGMGDEEALRQEWHGPFRTQAEASADEVRTLLRAAMQGHRRWNVGSGLGQASVTPRRSAPANQTEAHHERAAM